MDSYGATENAGVENAEADRRGGNAGEALSIANLGINWNSGELNKKFSDISHVNSSLALFAFLLCLI